MGNVNQTYSKALLRLREHCGIEDMKSQNKGRRAVKCQLGKAQPHLRHSRHGCLHWICTRMVHQQSGIRAGGYKKAQPLSAELFVTDKIQGDGESLPSVVYQLVTSPAPIQSHADSPIKTKWVTKANQKP